MANQKPNHTHKQRVERNKEAMKFCPKCGTRQCAYNDVCWRSDCKTPLK